MNYKELFYEMKKWDLRYVSAGRSQVHPFASTYEIASQLTKVKTPNEANVVFEFGDQLDQLVCLTCKCLDFKDGTIFRFKLSQVESHDELEVPKTTFETGTLRIKTVELFEPISGLYSIKPGESLDGIDEDVYVGNALLMEFTDGSQLEIYGTEGVEQHEPVIYLKFIDEDDKESFQMERSKYWMLKETI